MILRRLYCSQNGLHLCPKVVVVPLTATARRTIFRSSRTLSLLSQRGTHPAASTGVAASPSAATAAASSTATSATTASRLNVCPECGKRFMSNENLRQHRQARHMIHVPSPLEERYVSLVEENRALEKQLREVRARTYALRTGGTHMNKQGSDHTKGTGQPASFTAALPMRKSVVVDAKVLVEWRRSPRQLGTGLSAWVGVGTVRSPVLLGVLGAEGSMNSEELAIKQLVLQFTLETHSYQERRPGQQKLTRNRILVRYMIPSPDKAFRVDVGDVLRVQGNYALHLSYDLVSKQQIENVVVEADMIGLLCAAPSKEASTAQRSKRTQQGMLTLDGQDAAIASGSSASGNAPDAASRAAAAAAAPSCEELKPRTVKRTKVVVKKRKRALRADSEV